MSGSRIDGSVVSVEELLARATDAIGDNDDEDGELLAILSEHIVKIDPTHTVIGDATQAIELLAKQRAEDIGCENKNNN